MAVTVEEQARLDADLIFAIKASDTASVVALLEQGANPNPSVEVDLFGFGPSSTSALMLAMTWHYRRDAGDFGAFEGFDEPVVRAMIEGGARLEKASPYGATPLHEAVSSFGNYDLVAFMLDRGADVNEKFYSAQTALYTACLERVSALDVARLLLDRGADINHHDSSGRSLLMNAVCAREKDVVALLLARGADVHDRVWNGETAITLAQGKKKVVVEIRKMLETAGAKPDLLEEECRGLIKIVEEIDVLDTTLVDRWQELWRANLEDEYFNRAPLHHVHLLCRLGSLLAIFRGDFAEAIHLTGRLLSHPEANKLHPTLHLDLYGEKLYCLFQAGKENEAILLARQLMTGKVDGREIDLGLAKQRVRNCLQDCFETVDVPQTMVSMELTTLAWDISQESRRRPLKYRKLLEQATLEELCTLLRRKG